MHFEATHFIPLVLELLGQTTTAITVMRLFRDRLDTLKQGDRFATERGRSLTLWSS
jgi:hypothetical protein